MCRIRWYGWNGRRGWNGWHCDHHNYRPIQMHPERDEQGRWELRYLPARTIAVLPRCTLMLTPA
jgi:hypothetical protein